MLSGRKINESEDGGEKDIEAQKIVSSASSDSRRNKNDTYAVVTRGKAGSDAEEGVIGGQIARYSRR